ncbi:hypothetical protein TNCV_290971 [Trichonephila clavipes]|nr:hypothetical protein TNCV_290971 [Trichonephila clavipes]
MLRSQIAALLHPPSSIAELKRALREAWNRLSPQLLHHLIASMDRSKIQLVKLWCYRSKGSSTRGEFTSYKPAFLQAARKLAQCTHRTRLKAAFKKALEKVDSAGDFTRHSPAFERFRL